MIFDFLYGYGFFYGEFFDFFFKGVDILRCSLDTIYYFFMVINCASPPRFIFDIVFLYFVVLLNCSQQSIFFGWM